MNKRLKNKKVADLTVGQLLEILMVEVNKEILASERQLIEIMPHVVWSADEKTKVRPEVVKSLLNDFLHISPSHS